MKKAYFRVKKTSINYFLLEKSSKIVKMLRIWNYSQFKDA